METKDLLIKLDEKIKSIERAKSFYGYEITDEEILVNLLHEYESEITGLIEQDSSGNWFHKAFRQTDVVSGKIDFIIYGLLDKTNIFWECLSVE